MLGFAHNEKSIGGFGMIQSQPRFHVVDKGSDSANIAGKGRNHRRSIRLKGYDYTGVGAYFVTICTQDRLHLFGEIVGADMILNDAGHMVENCWNEIPTHFPHMQLDQFVVMPNHVHGILWITKAVGAKNISPLPPPSSKRPTGTSKTIGSIIRGFKIGVTKWMRQHKQVLDTWQRNYHEHIIRNEDDLNSIRQYIMENPRLWAEDSLNPVNAGVTKVTRP